jgi:hypothetical protein
MGYEEKLLQWAIYYMYDRMGLMTLGKLKCIPWVISTWTSFRCAAIQKLKRYKSPGTNHIPIELIKTEGKTYTFWDPHSYLPFLKQRWTATAVEEVYHCTKQCDDTNCSNYRRISVLPTSYIILPNSLLSRLTPYVDEITGHHQCGPQRNRSSNDQIFCIRQILEK